MNLDEVDKFIIVSILDAHKKGKNVTTWEMAKKYPWSQEEKGIFITNSDEVAFYTAQTASISYRLEKLEKYGLVTITKDDKNKKIYSITSNIKKTNHEFGKKFALALIIKDANGKHSILEI